MEISSAPVAICGLGMRLPGDISTPAALLEALKSGRDVRGAPDVQRYNSNAVFEHTSVHAVKKQEITAEYPTEGYWLKHDDITGRNFDPAVFAIGAGEADVMDPQQRLLLQVAWEALQSAGETERDWRGMRVGCFVGSFGDDCADLHAREPLHAATIGPAQKRSRLPACGSYAQANRVSHALDLRGPSMTVKSACSAGGVALHLACQSIRAGECDSALVMGVNVILSPAFTGLMAEQGVMATDASCKTFDAAADGYARAEAANCLFIKRMDWALRDGSPIRAVVRGSAVNSDGRTPGIATPSSEAQVAVIRSAYRQAGIAETEIAKTAMVECHGTGTAVGDAVEANAIASVFGDKGVVITSVKPNLGHSEGAAAITSIIKAILCLENRTIPPNIKFHSPSSRRQGCQHPSMGLHLLKSDPAFLADITAMDAALKTLLPAAMSKAKAWTLRTELARPAAASRLLSDPAVAQPALTALQVALVRRLARHGVRPGVVVGHSSGEVAAAYAAGVLTMEEAIVTAALRGHFAAQVAGTDGSGGMAAVSGLGRAEVEPLLNDFVVIACENSAKSLTLSGNKNALAAVVRNIKERYGADLSAGMLRVNVAYHSDHMKVVGADYQEALESIIQPKQSSVPFYSSVIGDQMHNAADFGPAYWRKNLESPVIFKTAVCRLLSDTTSTKSVTSTASAFVHLEIGPQATLAGPLRQIYTDDCSNPPAYVSLQGASDNSAVSFMAAMGELHCRGMQVDLPIPDGVSVLQDLPPYPWQPGSAASGSGLPPLSQSRAVQAINFPSFPRHQLLGSRIPTDNAVAAPTWRCLLSLAAIPWLADHKVGGDIVFPAAGYISMAVEVARQLATSPLPCRAEIRDMNIFNALILSSSVTVEVVTVAVREMLTRTDHSEWWAVSVHSVVLGTPDTGRGAQETWTRHCTFRVRASAQGSTFPTPEVLRSVTDEKYLLRKADPNLWYKSLARVGHQYGHHFQGIRAVRASVKYPAKVSVKIETTLNKDAKDGGVGSLNQPFDSSHPIIIDQLLQSLIIAAHFGQPQALGTIHLPTRFDQILVDIGRTRHSGSDTGEERNISAQTLITSNTESSVSGDCTVAVSTTTEEDFGPPVIRIKGMHFKKMSPDANDQSRGFTHNLVQPVWKPHIDMADSSTWRPSRAGTAVGDEFRQTHTQLEKLFDLCAEDVCAAVPASFQTPGHLAKQLAWLHATHKSGSSPVATSSCPESRDSAIRAALDRLQDSPAVAAATLLERCRTHAAAIFSGELQPLDVFIEGDLLTRLYDWMNSLWSYRELLGLVSHFHGRRLRVLEVGAGTGGLTACVLDALKDIEETKWMSFIMGFLHGWWLGDKDDRADQPYLASCDDWAMRLEAAGFSRPEEFVTDAEKPWQLNASFVARPACSALAPRKTTILANSTESESKVVSELETQLTQRGHSVQRAPFSSNDLPGDIHEGDIVSVVDVEKEDNEPLAFNLVEQKLECLKALLKTLSRSGSGSKSPTLLWVIGSCQAGDAHDPRQAAILGLARSVRNETGIHFAILETDSIDANSLAATSIVLSRLNQDQLLTSRTRDKIHPDMEFFHSSKSGILIPRLQWSGLGKALHKTRQPTEGHPLAKTLQITQPGSLDSLTWREMLLPPSPPANHVRIKVQAAGLNFKDVVTAAGVLGTTAHGTSLGLEASGTVLATQVSTAGLSVGDRVLVFAPNSGCVSTELDIPAQLCVPIPPEMDHSVAAALPCVFTTALRALSDRAGLKPGQTVLVHSAAGGLGLAAVQVARHLGAGRIFVTVGSPEKATFLSENWGIPACDVVGSSRDEGFVDGIMAATGGRGVDVVLNSLAGELLHASWQCVAPGGTFVELGKRDTLGHGRLAMAAFDENRSFVGVEMANLARDDPAAVARLLNEMMQLYRDGRIRPIEPLTRFSSTKAAEAVKLLSLGKQVGKIVVEFDDKDAAVVAAAKPVYPPASSLPPRLRPDAVYLITSSPSGLALSVARQLISMGANIIVFASRSADRPMPKTTSALEELTGMECQVLTHPCDVNTQSDLTNLISYIQTATNGKPIAGVLHMSMVLSDAPFFDMTEEQWHAAADPKIRGAWNLHQTLQSEPLEFFLLFGSTSGLCGQPDQANYASGNTFLVGLCRHRRSRGMPCSVLDLGPVEDVGFVAERQGLAEKLQKEGSRLVPLKDVLAALELAIVGSRPSTVDPEQRGDGGHFVIGLGCATPLRDQSNTIYWKRDPRALSYKHGSGGLSSFQNLGADASPVAASSARIAEYLAGLDEDGSKRETLDSPTVPKVLGTEIATAVINLLGGGNGERAGGDAKQEALLQLSPASQGLDSLVLAEVRAWWRRVLGSEVGALQLTTAASFEQLGALATSQLREKRSKAQTSRKFVSNAFMQNKIPAIMGK
ncbi:hypothetical protein PspLS_10429 [Pyricularia sp. CBS 133598]|nr:hypothetical protein PspLS_10429 [Pyricularia sp. CBS 133598]